MSQENEKGKTLALGIILIILLILIFALDVLDINS